MDKRIIETHKLVDTYLNLLLEAKNTKPNIKIKFQAKDLHSICILARELFLDEPMLCKLEAPINICGDIHGQFYDLIRVFEENGYPPKQSYLFLGDYVDRGKYSVETITFLFLLKIRYPTSITLLRGNHECENITKVYGFYDDCKRLYDVKTWKIFVNVFACMPVAAIVANKIFCVHGGLSPDLKDPKDILKIQRPVSIPDDGLLCDLLWSDPNLKKDGWSENERGVSYTYGCDVIEAFLKKNHLDLICRAHEVVEDGYEFMCNRKLVTVFTAPNYTGEKNAGAVLVIDNKLKCKFTILLEKPKDL